MGNRHQRRSREQWAAIIEGQEASDLTIADYCQANEVGLASFNKWKRRLRDDASKPNHPKIKHESADEKRRIRQAEAVPLWELFIEWATQKLKEGAMQAPPMH